MKTVAPLQLRTDSASGRHDDVQAAVNPLQPMEMKMEGASALQPARHMAGGSQQAVNPLQLRQPGINPLQQRVQSPALNSEGLPDHPDTQDAGAGSVIQRMSFHDFNTYDEAKNSNIYARKLLDSQKDKPIRNHFQEKFDRGQQDEIYKANKKHYGNRHITSDLDGTTLLYKEDITKASHIDHRFPKSHNGSNHYRNAAIIPGSTNIAKSNKLTISKEPTTSLAPYRSLRNHAAFDQRKLGKGREFSSEQRAALKEANETHYGQLTSDLDKTTTLNTRDTSALPHIDHITAKAEGGTNFYFNAMVLPANENLSKSGKRGTEMDLDGHIGDMTLKEYYEAKENGELRGGLPWDDLNERDDSDEDESEGLSEDEVFKNPKKKTKL